MFSVVPGLPYIVGRVTPEQANICGVRFRIGQQVVASRIRARRYGVVNTLTREQWETILNQSGGFCSYCKKRVGIENLGIDHILAMSKGGSNSVENAAPYCFPCNVRKGTKTL